MAVVVVDYGAGNLRSAAKALEAAGASRVIVSACPDSVAAADALVLPGVGAFGACAAALRSIDGMEYALNQAVMAKRRPFLGICVGMQLMAGVGHEYGCHRGLGWFDGAVRHLPATGLRIPHIGWNRVEPQAASLIEPGHAYFVHSYALDHGAAVVATTDYGGPVTAAIQKDNMLGVQFHPEKSQAYGIALLSRWLKWRP